MSLLAARGLAVRFGGLTAVDGVDFTVEADQVVGLIGPNGAGKTTVFNLITGLYRPTEGDVHLAGESLVGLAPHEIARRGVGRTFQVSRLFLGLSVLDNVLLGMYRERETLWETLAARRRLAAAFRRAIAEAGQLLHYFSPELAARPLRPAAELNQADRRRLEICRALASHPRLLLLDEPSAGMDPGETAELMEDIRKVQRRFPGMGLCIIEHDMRVVQGLADRVVALNYGRKVAEGSFEEVARDPEVRRSYLGGQV